MCLYLSVVYFCCYFSVLLFGSYCSCGAAACCCCSPSCVPDDAIHRCGLMHLTKLFGLYPLAELSQVQPRFTCNPILMIHTSIMHLRKLRACAEPRRAAARCGEKLWREGRGFVSHLRSSFLCVYVYHIFCFYVQTS